MKNFISYRLKS